MNSRITPLTNVIFQQCALVHIWVAIKVLMKCFKATQPCICLWQKTQRLVTQRLCDVFVCRDWLLHFVSFKALFGFLSTMMILKLWLVFNGKLRHIKNVHKRLILCRSNLPRRTEADFPGENSSQQISGYWLTTERQGLWFSVCVCVGHVCTIAVCKRGLCVKGGKVKHWSWKKWAATLIFSQKPGCFVVTGIKSACQAKE